MSLAPVGIYLGMKMWMYHTWLVYIAPEVSSTQTLAIILFTVPVWYCYLRCWCLDPGFVKTGQAEKMRRLVELVEVVEADKKENILEPARFCWTCLQIKGRFKKKMSGGRFKCPRVENSVHFFVFFKPPLSRFGLSTVLGVTAVSAPSTITVPGWATVSPRKTTGTLLSSSC